MSPWGWEERFGLRVQDFELWSFDGPRPSIYPLYTLNTRYVGPYMPLLGHKVGPGSKLRT